MATSVRKKFRPVDFMDDVGEELARARILFPVQETTLTPHEWLAILEELVQVGAMAMRMALSVKNRGDG